MSHFFFPSCSVLVMVVSFVSDRFAETECKDDSKNLNSNNSNRYSNDDVEITDDVIIYGRVAALESRKNIN